MKKIFSLFLCCFSFFALAGCTDSTAPNTPPSNDCNPQQVYFLSDIQAALAQGDYSSPDYEEADYPSVSFSSSFATLFVYSETYFQLYDISGNKAGSVYTSIITNSYDAVKIEHHHFSQYGSSIYRSVKVTLYKQNEIIVSPYEAISVLEAQFYFICGVDSLSVSAA